MDLQEQNLLSLLRTALWGVPACCDTPDWSAIAGLAERQTVTGLLYDAIQSLPSSQQPDGGIMRMLHLITVRIAQSHQLLNSRLARMSSLLKADGIRTVLLKGQGAAQNYPDPLRRCCGDIDLYVGEPDYARACRWLNNSGLLDDTAAESIQHLHFDYQGAHVELHRIAGVMFNSHRNRLFRQWIDTMLKGDTCRTVRIGDADILLPPVQFDALYIFYHGYKHFLTGGVGLRQLCDWVMYLHRFRSEIDLPTLEKDLRCLHLMRAWQVMGHIAVSHIGLPKEEFPFYNPSPGMARRAEVMTAIIMRDGNFGFHDPKRTPRPKGYLAGKAHTFVRMHRIILSKLPLFPAEMLEYYREYLLKGFAQIYKDKFTTKTITGTAE